MWRLVNELDIRQNFRFVIFQVIDKADRMKLKQNMISIVSLCDECKPFNGWLGNHSPVEKIRESGLWNVQGLYKDMMTGRKYEILEEIINSR